jgi:hypothetical protein
MLVSDIVRYWIQIKAIFFLKLLTKFVDKILTKPIFSLNLNMNGTLIAKLLHRYQCNRSWFASKLSTGTNWFIDNHTFFPPKKVVSFNPWYQWRISKIKDCYEKNELLKVPLPLKTATFGKISCLCLKNHPKNVWYHCKWW